MDTAHKIGYEYSLTHNYQYLITMDSDMSHDPKKIPEFIVLFRYQIIYTQIIIINHTIKYSGLEYNIQ